MDLFGGDLLVPPDGLLKFPCLHQLGGIWGLALEDWHSCGSSGLWACWRSLGRRPCLEGCLRLSYSRTANSSRIDLELLSPYDRAYRCSRYLYSTASHRRPLWHWRHHIVPCTRSYQIHWGYQIARLNWFYPWNSMPIPFPAPPDQTASPTSVASLGVESLLALSVLLPWAQRSHSWRIRAKKYSVISIC